MSVENTQKQQEVQAIIDQLEFKILKHAQQTIFKNREELMQEVKVLIVEKAYEMLDDEPMGFFEFIEKEILKEEIVF
ncbi:hypothetical protein [Priestia megaterium]|uniref:hypothetical protein n=1 Tax=Priestia megaterium TaxID=1404 RepID=UPI0032D8F4E2